MCRASFWWAVFGFLLFAARASHAAPATSAGNGPPAANAPQAAPATDSALSAADIYKKDLPSIVYVGVQTKDGQEGNGSGYVALKDGYVVTCWHVVHDAKAVTVRFSDGEEFEATGLVDHDLKNDLALIKIRAVGRPLLPMVKDDPVIGANVYVIGAPLGLDFTISNGIVSQIRKGSDGNFYQFTAAASPGNSGGPVVDSAGQVIGLVDWQTTEGQNLNFAVPAKYALALDPTLPTKPWSDVVDDTPPDKLEGGANSASNDDLDKLFGEALTDLDNCLVQELFVREDLTKKNNYQKPIPSVLFSTENNLKDDSDALSSKTSNDPDRERIRTQVIENLGKQLESLEDLQKAILQAQADNGWTSEANDLLSLSAAFPVKPLSSDDHALLLKSKAFTAAAPGLTAVWQGKSPFKLGFVSLISGPVVIRYVLKGGVIDRLGIRQGDAIFTINGQMVPNAVTFNDLLQQNVGQTVDIAVLRDEKVVHLKVQVPQLPS